MGLLVLFFQRPPRPVVGTVSAGPRMKAAPFAGLPAGAAMACFFLFAHKNPPFVSAAHPGNAFQAPLRGIRPIVLPAGLKARPFH